MDLKPEDILIKNAALSDLFYLSKNILRYRELDEKTHRPLSDFTMIPRPDIDLEPRGIFKTTIRTKGYAVWLIINNPDIRILLNHKILGKAKEMLREIKEHFERNEYFIYYFGDWRGSVWGESQIIVNRRKKILSEPTISIGSPDHEVTSGHYDVILNDDLIGLKDMVSLAERERILRFWKTQKYLLNKGGWIKNTGTRWHLEDVFNYLLKITDKKAVRVKSGLSKVNEEWVSNYPHRYDIEELLRMKKDDPVLFESQIQNNPTPLDDQLYPLEVLNMFDYDSLKPGYCMAYIDPAFGKKEKGEPCFWSCVVASVVNENIYIVEWPTNRHKPEQNEIILIDLIERYNIRQLGIESNAAQSEYIRNVKRKLKEKGIILGVEEISHTTNKDRRIQGMHGTILNNVYFRQDWETAYEEAMKQLTLYPYNKFKDAPDCLEGVLSMANIQSKPGEGLGISFV